MRDKPLRIDSDLADSLHNVGQDLYELRQYRSALQYHKQAMGIRRKLVKERPELFRPALAESLFYIGLSYQKLGCYDEAIEFYNEAAGKSHNVTNSEQNRTAQVPFDERDIAERRSTTSRNRDCLKEGAGVDSYQTHMSYSRYFPCSDKLSFMDDVEPVLSSYTLQ